jgi:glutamate 5-kinase
MLITANDFEVEEKHKNLANTLARLLELGALPIVNENDTVSTAELSIGDNDTLSALVAVDAKADMLILVSDIEGLYTADPHKNSDAQLISVVENVDDVLALGDGAVSVLGTGGMATKLQAGKLVTEAGIDMIIVNGAKPKLLYDIVEGKQVGTKFLGKKKNDD